jgi:hypothetical protein
MTRQAIEVPTGRPHRFVWYMQCDQCWRVSSPSWEQHSLSHYREHGWQCSPQAPCVDLCPECKIMARIKAKREAADESEG